MLKYTFKQLSNIIFLMGCIESQTVQNQSNNYVRATVRPERKKSRKPSRMSTKFKMAEVREISDDERHAGFKPCYACPICFLYFNKILACSECSNFTCFQCFVTYEKKYKDKMKCAFCSSNKSLFIDHQLEAHSYFDSTNNGFLSKEERNKIDQEGSKLEAPKGSKLQPIVQENNNNN